MSTVLVTGASGFVGSHLLPAIVEAGHDVRALVRDERSRGRVRDRLTPEQRAHVTFVPGDVCQPSTLPDALRGADSVIHLVAILRDRNGGRELERVNHEGTRNVLTAMRTAGVQRLVHLGSMGIVDDPNLHYAGSKARAEADVRASGLQWTILKPSLLWGERDGFFNLLASLVRTSPGVVPIPGGQSTRYQPLWVGDLVHVVVRCLERDDTVGHAYELGGPEYWTQRQMIGEVLAAMGKRRLILPLPRALIKVVARSAEALRLPFPVGSDQLRQLAFDNAAGLDDVERDLGFVPRSMKGQLGYLRRRRHLQEPSPA